MRRRQSAARLDAALSPLTSVVHTAVTSCLVASAASVNGTHLWLSETLRLLYASVALTVVVHVAVTFSIVLPVAPFDGACLGTA